MDSEDVKVRVTLFLDYRRVDIDTSVVVDRRRGERLTVHLNVTFPRVPCYCEPPTCHPMLSLDLIDITGELQLVRTSTHSVVETHLTAAGTAVPGSQIGELRNDIDKLNEQRASGFCGSCYCGEPPKGGCCNSCDAVREAYYVEGRWSDQIQEQSSEGCNVAGLVRVNKDVGNIHITPEHSFRVAQSQIYDFVPYLKNDGNRHDFSHTIDHMYLTVDDEADASKAQVSNLKDMRERLGIYQNSLDEHMATTSKAQYMFHYFLKTVSTQFRTLDGQIVHSHQYSVTHFECDFTTGQAGNTNECVFLSYEISPSLVAHCETRQSFAHFLTLTCAIVGDVLTVASVLDSALFATQRCLKQTGPSAATIRHVSGKLM
ncbi:endoplasmic reticulum-derived transport vesicle ERV46 [Lactifluus subvellereus]|nr:endoplasmic reticulum-derived transport vesicle ERV46 [Lactifluus subvellereus]